VVFSWLNKDHGEQWLMVVDNADDADLFYWTAERESQDRKKVTKKPLSEYLPRTLESKRKIIITTRNRRLGEDLSHGEPCINIPPFSFSEARSLLRSKGSDASANETDINIDKLLRVLGCIPLAITQAASFIRQRRISTVKYLGLLEKSELILKETLNKERQDHRREPGFANAVFPTWKLSYDQIREQHPHAAAMLSLMSMLDRQHIPETLLRNQNESDFEFLEAIGILDDYSLITREIEKDGLTLHRLVQLSVHLWLENRHQKQQYELEALTLISSRFPTGEHQNRSTCELLLPHAQSVLQGKNGKKEHKTQRKNLLYNMSWFDWRQGRYDKAYAKVSEAYEIDAGLYETETEETRRTFTLMALVLQDQGKYEEAETMARRALEGREKALGNEHLSTLMSVDNLALILQDQGKYEEAEQMNRQAVKGYEKALGKEHPDTLTSLNNLASILLYQGKYEEAEQVNRRALEGYEKALGREHPNTLNGVNNLASVLRYQKKYEEAELMNRRALKGKEKALGNEHPSTLMSVNNLASVLRYQGKYEEAELMNRLALKGREKALGKEHPDTLMSVYCLAYLYHEQRRYDTASELYQRACDAYKRILGPQHPTTVACCNNYSRMVGEIDQTTR
jgi:tetratricopeptide (TPR) repeat protein